MTTFVAIEGSACHVIFIFIEFGSCPDPRQTENTAVVRVPSRCQQSLLEHMAQTLQQSQCTPIIRAVQQLISVAVERSNSSLFCPHKAHVHQRSVSTVMGGSLVPGLFLMKAHGQCGYGG